MAHPDTKIEAIDYAVPAVGQLPLAAEGIGMYGRGKAPLVKPDVVIWPESLSVQDTARERAGQGTLWRGRTDFYEQPSVTPGVEAAREASLETARADGDVELVVPPASGQTMEIVLAHAA